MSELKLPSSVEMTLTGNYVDIPKVWDGGTDTNLVLYTDGGCKPSRGIGGWGVHGYLYNGTPIKQGTGLKGWIITETGYQKLDKGTNVNVLKYFDYLGSLIPESTNNVAELTAMLEGLKIALEYNVKKALIYTDSKYVVSGLTEWLDQWIKNDWQRKDKQPVANKELWLELLKVKEALEKNTVIDIKWVEGHSGDLGNEKADTLATKGIIVGRKGHSINSRQVTDGKGYWNPKVTLNRMFSNRNWYFNTGSDTPMTDDGRYIYHLGDHGKDDNFLSKKMSDSSFSVLYLKEKEPALEMVRAGQEELNVRNFQSIVIGRLDNIFKPKVYNELVSEGHSYLEKQKVNSDLYYKDEESSIMLTKEMQPPLLAFNLVDTMNFMQKILNSVIGLHDYPFLQITDITSLIYEEELKGKKILTKISPNLTSVVKSLSTQVGYDTGERKGNCSVTLTIGVDLPSRNTLSALAINDPKVKVVTWPESKQAFRYAVVIEAGEDVGIWAGFYSNIHLLL